MEMPGICFCWALSWLQTTSFSMDSWWQETQHVHAPFGMSWGMKKNLKRTAFNGIHRPVRWLCIIQILGRSPLGVLHPTLFAGYSICPANLLLWNLPKLVCLKNRVTPNSHMCTVFPKLPLIVWTPQFLDKPKWSQILKCMYTRNPLVDHQLSDDMVISWPIGSMVLVYMLTFGVYWWDPCYHI